MRVLLCNWRDVLHGGAGGAETYAHELMKRWAADGHEVTQFASSVRGQPARQTLDGVELVRGGSGRLGVYRAARAWYEGQKQGRFDVVIDGVNTRPFFCHEWQGRPPTVALIHQVAREVWFSEFAWPIASVGRWWLEPRWLARYRYVPTVTISDSSARSLGRYGLQRVVVAPIGFTEPPTVGGTSKEEQPTIVFVGRLAANKRPDHAVDAFELLTERFPDSQLWIVGAGDLAPRLQRSAPEGVTFFGRTTNSEKYQLMARAHVLVVTSVREGWGLVVDEAASVGTPTIGYDVDGLRDSVTAAEGVLVDPHPQALAQALIRHFDTSDLANTSGPLPHGALSWDQLATDFLDLVEEMIDLTDHPASDPLISPAAAVV